MLIFEVISLVNEKAKSTRKYKCTSGPRKGQRVAKPSTCSAPISHRSKSYGKDDEAEVRTYVPKKKKTKHHQTKKLRPKKSGIHTEAQLAEYGPGNPEQGKIVDVKPGQSATVRKKDGTEIKYNLKPNPQAPQSTPPLTKDAKGNITATDATNNKPGQTPNAASEFKKGATVNFAKTLR